MKGYIISNIRVLCDATDTTIASLEKKMKFGVGLISRWSTSEPSFSKIALIAEHFNISIDVFQKINLELFDKTDLLNLIQNNELSFNASTIPRRLSLLKINAKKRELEKIQNEAIKLAQEIEEDENYINN